MAQATPQFRIGSQGRSRMSPQDSRRSKPKDSISFRAPHRIAGARSIIVSSDRLKPGLKPSVCDLRLSPFLWRFEDKIVAARFAPDPQERAIILVLLNRVEGLLGSGH